MNICERIVVFLWIWTYSSYMYAVLFIDPARGYKQGSSVWRAAFTLVTGRGCMLTKIANRCIAAILTVECRPCIASIGQFYINPCVFIICHG